MFERLQPSVFLQRLGVSSSYLLQPKLQNVTRKTELPKYYEILPETEGGILSVHHETGEDFPTRRKGTGNSGRYQTSDLLSCCRHGVRRFLVWRRPIIVK